jgi:hypothetical protein
MNSKLVIIGLMISSLFAISVSGQKLPTIQQLVLQDDNSADHLIIVLSTGEYKFESCKGNISISGVGKVTVTGCKLDLLDMSEPRRVLAEVDLCEKVGKADIAFTIPSLTNQTDPPLFESVISDSNTRDSTFDCEAKPIVGK